MCEQETLICGYQRVSECVMCVCVWVLTDKESYSYLKTKFLTFVV